MQFSTLLVSAFAAVAAAQTFTTPSVTLPSRTSGTIPSRTSSGTTGGTGLVEIVNELPRCALSCLNSAAANIDCDPANFTCLCSKSEQLVGSIGLCVLGACESSDVAKLTDLTTRLCSAVNSNPDPTQVSSASNLVQGAINSAASSQSQAFAPRQTQVPAFAVMGGAAAALAAYAM